MFSWWNFSWKSRAQPIQLNISGQLESCTFCDVSKEKGFKIVWEDARFVVFEDIRPAAMHHLQVVPKTHIESVKALGKLDVDLVKTMEEIGHHVLDELKVPPSSRKLGFHIPPMTSVHHLHLHAQGLPYTGMVKRFKYPIVGGFGSYQKGFSWFTEVGQTIRILEGGGRVKIFPC